MTKGDDMEMDIKTIEDGNEDDAVWEKLNKNMQQEPMNLSIAEMKTLIKHGNQHKGMLNRQRLISHDQQNKPKTKTMG